MLFLILFCVSVVTWLMSILAGGGSPFILIPVVNGLLDATAVPPVMTLGLWIGNTHRMSLFWQDIDWKLTRWYLPGAIAGAILGVYAFTKLYLESLQLLIGLFFVMSFLGFLLGKKLPNWQVKAWYILPAGFVKSIVSGLVGTTGPVLNPFYLSYGLEKEQLIATKATHMMLLHSVKIISYVAFGVLSQQDIFAGLAIGLAAIPANILGKIILSKMEANAFRKIILATLAISGCWMLWTQRGLMGVLVLS